MWSESKGTGGGGIRTSSKRLSAYNGLATPASFSSLQICVGAESSKVFTIPYPPLGAFFIFLVYIFRFLGL